MPIMQEATSVCAGIGLITQGRAVTQAFPGVSMSQHQQVPERSTSLWYKETHRFIKVKVTESIYGRMERGFQIIEIL